jgi:hypothetical protein
MDLIKRGMKGGKAIVWLFCLFVVKTTLGQEAVNDPFSRLGIGIMNLGSNGNFIPFGASSISMFESGSIQLSQPASYALLKETTFQGSLMGHRSEVSDLKTKSSFKSAHVAEVAVGLKRNGGRWGFGMGLNNYSSVGYNLSDQFVVNDSTAGKVYYTGDGGLQQFVFGAGRSFVLHNDTSHIVPVIVSLGANLDLVFGTISNYKKLDFQTSSIYNVKFESKTSVFDAKLDFGAQFQVPLWGNQKRGKRTGIGLLNFGATYSPQTQISATRLDAATNYYKYLGMEITIDSAYSSYQSNGQITLPSSLQYGVGLTYLQKNGGRFWFGLGAMLRNGSAVSRSSFSDPVYQNTTDLKLYSVSAEWVPLGGERARSILGTMRYRLGYSQYVDYLQLHGNVVTGSSYSAGVAIPIRASRSNSTLSLGYSWNQKSLMLEESRLNYQSSQVWLSFQFCPFEKWFVVRKYD